jgi:hypothetical protein
MVISEGVGMYPLCCAEYRPFAVSIAGSPAEATYFASCRAAPHAGRRGARILATEPFPSIMLYQSRVIRYNFSRTQVCGVEAVGGVKQCLLGIGRSGWGDVRPGVLWRSVFFGNRAGRWEIMRRFFRQPFDDVMTCLERLMLPREPRSRPIKAMIVVLVSLAVTWFIYVPIHELLHVAGCHVAGGEVLRLELSARYGAAWLSKIFPFVVSGSDYAGQVTGFDTKGSDWIYLATDFGPFVLTILFGVPMLKLAGRKRRPVLFGAAIVVGLAPFYNLPGDYYEMGSITTTRVVTALSGPAPKEEIERLAAEMADPDTEPPELLPAILQSEARFARIRSDDIYSLMGNLVEKPGALGLTSPGLIVVGVLLAIISMAMAILFAFATYWLGDQFAHGVLRMRRVPSPLSS